MTLDELIDEVRERLGETTEADFFTDAEITRSLNEAVRRFSNEERWPWLYTEFEETTTADEDDIDLPDDVSINRVFALNIMDDSTLNGGQMLERLTPMEGFRSRHAYRNGAGVPRWYYISHTNLNDDGAPPLRYTARLIPTPDQAYTITGIYMLVPPLLSGAGDEPVVPEEYQQALPAYAAGLLFLKELEISQKASEQFQIYNSVLQNARKDTQQQDLDEIVAWGRSKPSGGRGRFGYGDQRDGFWNRITSAGLGQ